MRTVKVLELVLSVALELGCLIGLLQMEVLLRPLWLLVCALIYWIAWLLLSECLITLIDEVRSLRLVELLKKVSRRLEVRRA